MGWLYSATKPFATNLHEHLLASLLHFELDAIHSKVEDVFREVVFAHAICSRYGRRLGNQVPDFVRASEFSTSTSDLRTSDTATKQRMGWQQENPSVCDFRFWLNAIVRPSWGNDRRMSFLESVDAPNNRDSRFLEQFGELQSSSIRVSSFSHSATRNVLCSGKAICPELRRRFS